jgi:hypothetical protein
MSFLNPLFLFGLAAAAIPIVIHLFTRRRPRERPFPSLEFLSEVNQSEIRRLRLRQWLLLALRTLAVAAIALAMARPAVRGAAGPRATAATTLVALVDRSGSMGAAGASGLPLAGEARRVIEDLIATMGPADEMLLVPYDRAAEPATARPTGDAGRLRAVAQAFEAGARSTDHLMALDVAAQALAASHALNRELFWISDFQASGFVRSGARVAPSAPSGPWDKSRIYLVPLAPRTRANAAITEAAPSPAEGGPALTVSGASFDAPPGDLAVEVKDGDREIGRGFLNLPPRGEASALLPLSAMPEQGGIARIPDDVLPLDNARAFAAGRAGTLRVLLREDGPPSPLRLALEAGSPESGIALETVDAAALPARLADADVLVIHDLERIGPVELQAMLDWWRAGGGLLLAPGRHADAAFWNASVLGAIGAGTLGELEDARPGAAWRLTREGAGHAVLAGFPARPGEPLSSARFATVRGYRLGGGARALLTFDRDHPALIEAPHALVFAAPLDAAASDFAVSGAFLPLIHQCVKVLGRGTAAPSLAPGDRYRAPAPTGAWRIEDALGREVASELEAKGGSTVLVSAPLEHTGLYRVLQGGKLRSTFAVNPDPAESDLMPASDASLIGAFPPGRAQVLRASADFARRVREARFGRELWSWFVALALLLLAAETILGRWGLESTAPASRGSAAR